MTDSSYPFDPTYGYTLDTLKTVLAPEEPEGFAAFWEEAFDEAMDVTPRPQLLDTGKTEDGWRVFDLKYTSTGGVQIGGWALLPEHGKIKRGFVVGHGYGGREGPDTFLPLKNSALLFPCFRGISRSPHPPISADPQWHVLHDIDKPNRYVHRGCVQDLWIGVSALLRLFPQVENRLGYLGISFGGGIGALAIPWDRRVVRAHLNVPSFGNHPIRLSLPSHGSAESVRDYAAKHPERAVETLPFYDAAVAARRIRIPVHCACALFDPFVAPPGQFAVYNSLTGPKKLFVLKAGHHPYPDADRQGRDLRKQLKHFFKSI